jgi:anti-anti-sigma factor
MSAVPAASDLFEVDIARSTWPVASVAVTGDVDLETAPLLVERLLATLRTRAPRRLLLDLSGVEFLDCAGISALVTVRIAARGIGCRIRIANPGRPVRRILALTCMLDAFTLPDDVTAPR